MDTAWTAMDRMASLMDSYGPDGGTDGYGDEKHKEIYDK